MGKLRVPTPWGSSVPLAIHRKTAETYSFRKLTPVSLSHLLSLSFLVTIQDPLTFCHFYGSLLPLYPPSHCSCSLVRASQGPTASNSLHPQPLHERVPLLPASPETRLSPKDTAFLGSYLKWVIFIFSFLACPRMEDKPCFPPVFAIGLTSLIISFSVLLTNTPHQVKIPA